MTAREIEIAVAQHFNWRRNLIIPNVYWGIGLNHEADILVLSQSGYASEIEIKISRADLLRDREKPHGHHSEIVKAFWFAVPSDLAEFALANIPDDAGLLHVEGKERRGRIVHHCAIARPAKLRQGSRKFSDAERYQLARLGLMRYWTLRVPEEARA